MMWSQDAIDRDIESGFTDPVCSHCHERTKPIRVDNGYEAGHHVWQTISSCCDSEVVDGYDCRWCGRMLNGEECSVPCEHGN
jgi:hypothetical protein